MIEILMTTMMMMMTTMKSKVMKKGEEDALVQEGLGVSRMPGIKSSSSSSQ